MTYKEMKLKVKQMPYDKRKLGWKIYNITENENLTYYQKIELLKKLI